MGPINAIAMAAGIKSAEKLVEQVLTDLYDLVKGATTKRIKVWNVKRSSKQLYIHVKKIRLVKTLWQVDKAVDLNDFYCDSHLVLDKKRTKIRNLDDLGSKTRILISGIAGQGKSIFLRYLCSKAFLAGNCIPVFIELRRITSSETISSHAIKFFEIIGCTVDDEILKVLLGSGKVILFLDGFDEVAEADKPRIIHDVEHLASVHDGLRIIVTSRPESGLEVSPLFEVVKLDNLSGVEYEEVIHKLSDNKAFAENLIKQVEAHKSKLKELLCTPLLVTLLVMSYKSFQELPEELSDFYDSIFQVLLQRHDGVKPGFKRPRRCSFNDNQYRSVFEGLCYESKNIVKSIFEYEDILRCATKSLGLNRLKDDPEKYVDDIVKVTCLILKEGKDYRFIHKSVQEYYAAAFIKHRSEPVAKRFYSQLHSVGLYGDWKQEIRFLSEIDRYRYSKYFYLPYLANILNCSPDALPATVPVADIERTLLLLGDVKIGFAAGKDTSRCSSIAHIPHVPLDFIGRMFTFDYSWVAAAVESKGIVIDLNRKDRIPHEFAVKRYYITVRQMIDFGQMHEQYKELAQRLLNNAYHEAVRTAKYINLEEAIDITIRI